MITQFDGERLNEYLGLAKNLRANGIGAEVYPDTKKIGQQLKFADRRGFRLAIIAGVQEFERGQVQIKDLKTGEASDVALEADGASIVAHIKSLLG